MQPSPNPLARAWMLGECANALPEEQQPVAQLPARWCVASAFFHRGLTKLRDWDTTLPLFSDEHHLPLLNPTVAACLGTAGELTLQVLRVFGLGGRFAAAGRFVLNIVAAWSLADIADATLQQHVFWCGLLTGRLPRGPDRWALDRVLLPGLRRVLSSVPQAGLPFAMPPGPHAARVPGHAAPDA